VGREDQVRDDGEDGGEQDAGQVGPADPFGLSSDIESRNSRSMVFASATAPIDGFHVDACLISHVFDVTHL
jgi:hypothetical protein